MQKQTKVLLAIIVAVAILGVAVLYSGGGLQGKLQASPKGKLQITVDSFTPPEDIVVAGSNHELVSVFKATASGDEGFVIKKLTVVNSYDKVKGDNDNNIGTVCLAHFEEAPDGIYGAYINDACSPLIKGVATFSGLNLIVPENDNLVISINADFNTLAGGATSGEKVALNIDRFDARGLESGGVFSGHVVNKIANWMHVYGSKPILALNANSPAGDHAVSTNDKVLVFDVIADPTDGLTVEKVLIKLMSDGSFKANTNAPINAVLQDEAGNIVSTNPELFASGSQANIEFITQFELDKGEKRTLTLVLDTAALMNNQVGVDDLLVATINYGTSLKGIVTPGGLAWEDSTHTNAEWLGAQSSTSLSGNALKY